MKKITIVIPAGEKSKIEAFTHIDSNNIQTIVERGNNPSKNRNKGIKKSKTEFVAFINSHTLLDKTWLKEVLNFFKKHPQIDIVGGPQLTSKKEALFGKASGFALSSPFGSGGIYKRYSPSEENLNADETSITSANLICRKRVFKKIKFDETIYPGEDPKFIEDAIKNKFKVAYSPKIKVYNLRRKNLSDLIKQIFNYGKTRPQKENLKSTIKKPFFLIPSLLVIYLALVPSLLLITPYFIFPFIAYILLDVIFSFYESIKNREILAVLLLLAIFPVIHISYGLGFLYGSLKKNGSKTTS